MEFIIITGLSGSGKTKAINALEDIGVYCVDNVPPAMIVPFAELLSSAKREYSKVAIVTDLRSGDLFTGLIDTINKIKSKEIQFKLLFIESDEATLNQRFKETRRKHPLIDDCGGDLISAIKKEKEILQPLRNIADYIIDTSDLKPVSLKERINALFLENSKMGISIHCVSFGFKYGIAQDADLVFDVRCLPNPFYVPELKDKVGIDKEVRDYVLNSDKSTELVKKINDMIDFLIPLYVNEGKCQLVIAFGCTGGKHRSVTFAEEMYRHLTSNEFSVSISHRDIDKK